MQQTYSGGDNDAFVTKLNAPARVTRYTYDGLLRLIGAAASPGNSYTYMYDLAGNRTSVQTNGGTPTTRTYNAADQITNAGYSYDLVGNLLTDGTLTSTYDALNRTKTLAGAQSRTYTYNGDGVLVRQVAGATTTDYTQDLAAPLSQVLQTKLGATTTDYLFGQERLASLSGATRTWYLADALGSVRRTVADSGTPTAPVLYDPWGTVESGAVPTFGFTGELQDTAVGLVNLRARWYSTGQGTFTSRDRWPGIPTQSLSLHQCAYVHDDPINATDPTGEWRFTAFSSDSLSVEHNRVEGWWHNVWHAFEREDYHIEYRLGESSKPFPKDLRDLFTCSFPGKGGKYSLWAAEVFKLDLLDTKHGELFEIKPDLWQWHAAGLTQVIIDTLAMNYASLRGLLEGTVPAHLENGLDIGKRYNWNGTFFRLGIRFPARQLIDTFPEYQLWAGLRYPGVVVYWHEPLDPERYREQRKKDKLIRKPGHKPGQRDGEPENDRDMLPQLNQPMPIPPWLKPGAGDPESIPGIPVLPPLPGFPGVVPQSPWINIGG